MLPREQRRDEQPRDLLIIQAAPAMHLCTRAAGRCLLLQQTAPHVQRADPWSTPCPTCHVYIGRISGLLLAHRIARALTTAPSARTATGMGRS